jgi:hypothetical protein
MVNAHNTEQADGDTFVIHMTRAVGESAKVTSIELLSSDMRNRYSFKEPRLIGEVFANELSAEIEQTLASFEDRDRVVSLPDFEVDLPGLLLSGLRVLLTRIEGGVEVIMMRFREYIGAIKSAFKFDSSFAITSASVRERIAVEVLRDILTPLVDMINLNRPEYRAVIENHAPVLQKRLDQIATRQEELNFYSGLLQRYVAGCRQDLAKEVDSIVHR